MISLCEEDMSWEHYVSDFSVIIFRMCNLFFKISNIYHFFIVKRKIQMKYIICNIFKSQVRYTLYVAVLYMKRTVC